MVVVGPNVEAKQLIFKMYSETYFTQYLTPLYFYTGKCNKYTSKWSKNGVNFKKYADLEFLNNIEFPKTNHKNQFLQRSFYKLNCW